MPPGCSARGYTKACAVNVEIETVQTMHCDVAEIKDKSVTDHE